MKNPPLIISLLITLGLIGCGEQVEKAPAAAPTPAAETTPATSAPSASGGGYEPSADERVPGITMSQEELDKLYAAAKADIPAVKVPGEAASE